MKLKTNGIVFILTIFILGICCPASAEVVDRIVAIIDTDIVTHLELEREVTPFVRQAEAAGYSRQKTDEMLKEAKLKILDRLIEKSLTAQEAAKYRIKISPAEIEAAVTNIKQSRSMDDETFEAALNQEGLTLEAYKADLEKQILRARLIDHAVKSKVVISKSEIQKYYEEHKAEYAGVKKYHLRNILIDTEEKINEVKQMLDEDQAFADVARLYSQAPNGSDGGDLGLFEPGSLPRIISDALLPLSIGQHTDVISTGRGFQVFYLQDIVMDGGKTVEQAHDIIHGILYAQQVELKFKTWMEALKEKAHIKIML